MRKHDDPEFEAWLKDVRMTLIASAGDGVDVEEALLSVRRQAAELNAYRAAASTEEGGMRLNRAGTILGRFFRANSDVWLDDVAIYQSTGVMPGKSYSIIRQFIDAGWLDERWEEGTNDDDQARRLFYQLTSRGAAELPLAIAQWELDQPAESAHGFHKPKEV